MQNNCLGIVTNPKVKLPVNAFKVCPTRGCNNPHLKTRGIDVHCTLCGWESDQAFIDAGGLDWWENRGLGAQQSSLELSL